MRRFVALVAFVTVLVPLASAPTAGAQSTVDVSPITANLDVATNTTEYTVQILAPAGTNVQVNWNKPSCGTWERPAPTLFRWTHPHPPCEGALLHPEETITVIVTVRELDIRFTCNYVGADSGAGEDCASRSLGLAASPTPTATSPTASPSAGASATSEPVPVEEAGGGIADLMPMIAIAAGALVAVALIIMIVVALRRRRERALDPCAPRQRRGMRYLAEEIAAYAEQNRIAAMRAAGQVPLVFPSDRSVGELLSDLWMDSGGREARAAWSSVLGTDEGLVRSTRSPELAARSRGWLGQEGPWRASAEVVASRITARTGAGYAQARSAGWATSLDSIVGRLQGMDAPVAAAIAANAFASAAIAAADALERLNEASEAAGCPTVPMPEVRFVTIPSDADPSSPGGTFLIHSLAGGETSPLTADELNPQPPSA